jgi:photosystem II stability/assembly factor-like uncharacterized protein
MSNLTNETELQDIVYALAASPDFSQDGICFAARASGLYNSHDGGITWQPAYASLNLETPLATLAVAVSPDFNSDRSVFAGVPGGILRSVDGGRSWHVATLPSPPPVVSSLVVSPNFSHDGVLLAGTLEDGVFRSSDRGSHWSAWNFGLLDLNVLCMVISPDFANDETLFVGTDSGIFRSTNGGRAWREVDFSPDFAPVLSLALSPGYAADGILFAGTEPNGLFCSHDRGQTWLRLGEEMITDPVNSVLTAPVSTDTPDVLVLSGDALLVSRDGGQSWANWAANLPADRDLAAVAAPRGFAPNTRLLVGLADGAILYI